MDEPKSLPGRFSFGLRALGAAALATGLALRLVGLSLPPFDAHSFRQCQTLWTIEDFYANGIDLLHPRTNYVGYPQTFVLELPLFQALMALGYQLLGPHLEIIRLWNILMGLGSVWLLYRVTAYLLDRNTAVWAAMIYWLAPLNITYQRSMLLDPTAVVLVLVSFDQIARLLQVRPSDRPSESGQCVWRRAARWAVFALATWTTALIKTLYLWPTVCLLAWRWLDQRRAPNPGADSSARVGGWRLLPRPTAVWLGLAAILAVAGASVLLWGQHAARVNAASPVMRGTGLASHLGLGALVDPEYYREVLVRRPKAWLGGPGVLLYAVGLYAVWRERHDRARTATLLTLTLIPPTYLLVFSNINRPHDYYQLIIAPFLAIVAANGARWLIHRIAASAETRAAPSTISSRTWTWMLALGTLLLLAAPLHYLVWKKQPRPLPQILELQRFTTGRFRANAAAMFFASPAASGLFANSYVPEYLYGLKLWGFGRIAADTNRARAWFEQFAHTFPHLDYVIFWGLDFPEWMPDTFRLATRDDARRFYVFEPRDAESSER